MEVRKVSSIAKSTFGTPKPVHFSEVIYIVPFIQSVTVPQYNPDVRIMLLLYNQEQKHGSTSVTVQTELMDKND